MKNTTSIISGITCVATDIAFMQILFTTISSANRGNGAWPGFLVWLICGSMCYLINLAVLKKSATVPVLAILNLALLAALIFILIRNTLELVGFFNYAFLALFSIITVAESIRFALHPVSLLMQLRRFDALILTLFWLFLNYAAGLPRTDLPLMVIVLMLNFICNVMMRAAEHDVGGILCGSPVAGPALYCGLAGGGAAVVYFLVRFLSPGSRDMVSAVVSALRTAILGIFSVLGRFISWLASLIPYREQDSFDMEMANPPSVEAGEEIASIDVPPLLKYIIAGVIIIAALGTLSFFVYRMRRTRISLKTQKEEPKDEPRRKRTGGSFKRRVNSLIEEFKFFYMSVLRRNTSPGTLIYLERWGKKHGCVRGKGESMREYLVRLSPEGCFLPLSHDLDSMFFGGYKQSLSKPDYRRLRREIHKQKT